jgi:hypothetical protein
MLFSSQRHDVDIDISMAMASDAFPSRTAPRSGVKCTQRSSITDEHEPHAQLPPPQSPSFGCSSNGSKKDHSMRRRRTTRTMVGNKHKGAGKWTSTSSFSMHVYALLLVLFLLYDLMLLVSLLEKTQTDPNNHKLQQEYLAFEPFQPGVVSLSRLRGGADGTSEQHQRPSKGQSESESRIAKDSKVPESIDIDEHYLNLNDVNMKQYNGANTLDTTTSSSVVHIFHTRFMQHQPALLELGKARLLLFELFCLPTMVHQTSQNFVWIIRTDPALHVVLRQQLIHLVQPFDNIMLVANLDNPFGNFRNWNSNMNINDANETQAAEFQPDHVWSGSIHLFQHQHHKAQDHVLIETRLDADDGLHVEFVQSVQEQALRLGVGVKQPPATETDTDVNASHGHDFPEKKKDKAKHMSIPPQSLMFFCTAEHYEWHYDGGDADADGSDDAAAYPHPSGRLLSRLEDYCITPGLSIARSPTFHKVFKHIDHTLIAMAVEECRQDIDISISGDGEHENENRHQDTNCISWNRHLIPGAIRSRTPTSAGMKYVGIGVDLNSTRDNSKSNSTSNSTSNSNSTTNSTLLMKEEQLPNVIKTEETAAQKWHQLEEHTFVRQSDASITKTYLMDHMKEIALDNLKGQCTFDHSCKKTAMQRLLRLAQG